MIKRRDFLKFGGAAAAMILLPSRPLLWLAQGMVEANIKNVLYRGTRDGMIYTSRDRGITWELHTDFGPDYAIQDIFVGKHGLVYLKVGFQEYSFLLSVAGGEKVWRTAS